MINEVGVHESMIEFSVGLPGSAFHDELGATAILSSLNQAGLAEFDYLVQKLVLLTFELLQSLSVHSWAS